MNPANEFNYPFTAIVGQSDMKLALCLIAVQLAAVLHASYQPMEGLRIDPE